jgi:dTMP kinase
MIDEKQLKLAMDKIKDGSVILYAMSGKMGAGKDTIGDKIFDTLKQKGFNKIEKVSYSTPMKKEMQAIVDFYWETKSLDNTAEKFNAKSEEIDKFLELLNGQNVYERTPESRLAIQFWGTDVRRKQSPDYWVNKLVKLIVNYLSNGVSVFVSDVRYEDEADSIIDLGGKIIRLETPENIRIERIIARDNLVPTYEQLNHKSEISLDGYNFEKIFDGCDDIEILTEKSLNYILNKKGLFITLEGPDGSGKSTIAKLLKKYIEDLGYKCVLTREPGGTDISEKIRNLLLDNGNVEMTDKTEALLYAAARAQHTEEKIKPLLNQGVIVISDRYVLSSLAYQGHSRGLGIDEVMNINKFAMGEVYPDCTLFFDVDPEIALSRKFINREGDRLENEGRDFHKKTYEGYKKAIETYWKNIRVIDANNNVKEVLKQCKYAVDELLENM